MNSKNSNKLTIQIVIWNSERYLERCLKSIFDQSQLDFNVLIIDNASNDNGVEWIRNNYPEVNILKNPSNIGFSKAHNQGLNLQHSPYVLLMNPDVILDKDFVKNSLTALETKEKCGALCGKLKRYSFSTDDLNDIVESGIIDATGLKICKNQQTINRGAGEKDRGQFDKAGYVFGAPGALVLYKRQALDSVSYRGEIFDESLFAYKEDVDLSWRMQLLGWESWYEPKAEALHYREAKESKAKSNRAITKARKSKSAFVNYLSYKNHFRVVYKNIFLKNYFRYFVHITWYEFKKLMYILIFERKTIKTVFENIRYLPALNKKRKYIQKRIVRDKEVFNKWYE